MELPYVTPTASPIAQMLVQAAQTKREREQQAFQNLLAQQRLQLDAERQGAEERRAAAQERRAQVSADREARMEREQMRAARLQGVGALMPYMDPQSPQFDPGMAQQLGTLHGLSVSTAAPQEPGPAPIRPQAPSFEGPIEDPEHAAARARQDAAGQMSPQDGPVMPRVDQAGARAAQEVISQQQERDAFTRDLATFDQRQREHSDQLAHYQQQKQFPTLNVGLGEGLPTLTFDTAAMHQRQAQTNQQRAQMYQQLYADDPVALRTATAMATLGRPDKEIEDAINKQTAARDAFQNKRDMAELYQLTAEQKYRLGQMNAAAHATSANATASGKEDAASARAQALIGQAMGRAEKMVDWKGIAANRQTLRSLDANLAPGSNPLQHKDAMIQLARYFRQAQPTEGEMHLLYSKLGGTVDKMDQLIASLKDGDVSPKQLRYVMESRDAIKREQAEREHRAFEALRTSFGPGSGYEQVAPQINAQLRAHGQSLGIDVPDVYPNAPDGGGATLLGSRAKKKGNNPLTDMAKRAKLAPKDQQAVDWANAHKNDPRARQILDAHGL